MKAREVLSFAAGVALVYFGLYAGGCATNAASQSGGESPVDAEVDTGGGGDDAGGCFGGCPEAGEAGPSCQGLQCQWKDCAATGASQETTLTGTIYDPAGNLPLYNVYVYVPNTAVDPIVPGSPTCTPCEAPASGSPIVGALTDAKGNFTLVKGQNDKFGVPGGDNIPIVVQAGKWRRQAVIAHVNDCANNDLNALVGKDALRLPKKSSEGDMPLIAFTSGGCDPAECFLRHVGIDDSEFVAPGGMGHVHFFTGQNGDQVQSGAYYGSTFADTYTWWENLVNLQKYDIVFNACECVPYDRGATAYTAMKAYLEGGGRLFATHYYYNWFAVPTGPADFQSVAAWNPAGTTSFASHFIDTSFPKGKSFSDWLLYIGAATTAGGGTQIAITDVAKDVDLAGPPMYPKSTRWIYGSSQPTGSAAATSYLSFNTPVAAPTDKQCGRAVFSDVHLSGIGGKGAVSIFPDECASADPMGLHVINEKALEFLFFDLSSCVQDDTQPPPPPPR